MAGRHIIKDVIAKEEQLKQIEDSTKLICIGIVPIMIATNLKRFPHPISLAKTFLHNIKS